MTIQRLDYLLNQAENNLLSEPEAQELTAWYRSFSGEPGLTATLSPEQLEQLEKWMWSRIHTAIAPPAPVTQFRRKPLLRWSAAAAIVLLLAAGEYAYLRLQKHRDPTADIPSKTVHDAAPGGNRATLTLGDGSVISLDSARNGVLSNAAGVAISKQASGQLVYRTEKATRARVPETAYNTLSTPMGGQYQVVLPDGTDVWMNAASTLRYPCRFSGTERAVELSGEAYFEVAKDPGRPFIVHTRNTDIQVLGTRFNVMAYGEEKKQITTLLDGSVKVVHGAGQEMLKPGQQAAVQEADAHILVSDAADVGAVVAWKNGLFQFNDVDLPTILRQAARWYDIRVAYAGPVSGDLYRGKISRNAQLSSLLKVLALNGVRFTIEGKTLTVH